jgi:hypothetical protein
MYMTSWPSPYSDCDSCFPVKPLSVRLLSKPKVLTAGEQYNVTCEAVGSRPQAKISWHLGKDVFQRGEVSNGGRLKAFLMECVLFLCADIKGFIWDNISPLVQKIMTSVCSHTFNSYMAYWKMKRETDFFTQFKETILTSRECILTLYNIFNYIFH